MTKFLALLHSWLLLIGVDLKALLTHLKAFKAGKIVDYWKTIETDVAAGEAKVAPIVEAVLKDEPALKARLKNLMIWLAKWVSRRCTAVSYVPLTKFALLIKSMVHPIVQWIYSHARALWGHLTFRPHIADITHTAAVEAGTIHKISGLISVVLSLCAVGGGAYGAHHYYRNHHGAPQAITRDIVAYTVIFQDTNGRLLKTEHVAVGDLSITSSGLTITHEVTGLTEHWAGNYVLLPLH